MKSDLEEIPKEDFQKSTRLSGGLMLSRRGSQVDKWISAVKA